jgi:3-oxoacyl-[acyl-carrier protein] reductase
MHTFSLSKKVIVISGGTGYVGSSVGKVLSEAGASIALLYHAATEEKVTAILNSFTGDTHRAYACDLQDEHAVITTLEMIEKEQGAIYGCVHTAAGKPLRKKFVDTPNEDFDKQVNATLRTSFNLLRHIGKRLQLHNEGVIIAITTAGVVVPQATVSLGAYTAAKYGVQGILTMLKEELRTSGVRVHSVAPGFMSGGMNSDIPLAFVEMITQKSPTKTLASSEMVALKVLALCTSHDETLTHLLAPEYE